MTNCEKLLVIMFDILVIATLINGVLTGNNWSDPGIRILCAVSMGLNVLFAECLLIGKR